MKKKNFKADMILNKKFSTELSGYNAAEVDSFFDKVIEDYRLFEERIESLEEIVDDNSKVISDKEEKNKASQMEIYNLKEQLKQTEKATNVELMREFKNLKDQLKSNKF